VPGLEAVEAGTVLEGEVETLVVSGVATFIALARDADCGASPPIPVGSERRRPATCADR